MLSLVNRSAECGGIALYDPGTQDRKLTDDLPGFEAHTRAGMALAWEAASDDLLFKVLLFGWPGTGKTLFPRHLQGRLSKAGLNYYLLQINCPKSIACIGDDESSRERDFSAARAAVAAEQFRPLIIALDGIEILTDGPESMAAAIRNWVLGILANDRAPGGMIVLGIASFPDDVDPVIRDKMQLRMFVDVPSANGAARLLQALGVEHAQAIVAKLYQEAIKDDAAYSPRSLLRGVQYARSILGPLESHNAQEVGATMAAACSPVGTDELQLYREANRAAIEQSTQLLELWDRRYDKHFPHDKALSFKVPGFAATNFKSSRRRRSQADQSASRSPPGNASAPHS